MRTRRLIAGTRRSPLAKVQTAWVLERLRRRFPELVLETREIVTEGDRLQKTRAGFAEGKGIFVKEIQEALRSGEIDFAVHSLKDLPVETTPGLELGAIPRRADPRDVCLFRRGATWESLVEKGGRIGTSSPRRAAQLKLLFPKTEVFPMRGNVDTRVRKLDAGEADAIVLAWAGLQRLGIAAGRRVRPLGYGEMIPAPGQGALAVEIRKGDARTRTLVRALHHPVTQRCVEAERELLGRMGGGCRTPIGAVAAPLPSGRLLLWGGAWSPDGRGFVQAEASGLPRAVAGALVRKLELLGLRKVLSL